MRKPVLALLCPPAYCARYRSSASFVSNLLVYVVAWLLVSTGMLALVGMLLWVVCVVLATSDKWPRVSVLVAIVVIVLAVAIGLRVYRELQSLTRLVADQSVTSAARSAVATYYAKHGSYPDTATLYTMTSPSPPVFQCSSGTVTVDGNTGVVTYSPNDIASC